MDKRKESLPWLRGDFYIFLSHKANITCLATGDCVWTRQNADIYALFAKFDFARTTKYEQSRLRQKSSKIAAFWLQASIALRF